LITGKSLTAVVMTLVAMLVLVAPAVSMTSIVKPVVTVSPGTT